MTKMYQDREFYPSTCVLKVELKPVFDMMWKKKTRKKKYIFTKKKKKYLINDGIELRKHTFKWRRWSSYSRWFWFLRNCFDFFLFLFVLCEKSTISCSCTILKNIFFTLYVGAMPKFEKKSSAGFVSMFFVVFCFFGL